jgi:hypothetical protein
VKYVAVPPVGNSGGWWKVLRGAETMVMIAPNFPQPEMWAKVMAEQANRGLKENE